MVGLKLTISIKVAPGVSNGLVSTNDTSHIPFLQCRVDKQLISIYPYCDVPTLMKSRPSVARLQDIRKHSVVPSIYHIAIGWIVRRQISYFAVIELNSIDIYVLAYSDVPIISYLSQLASGHYRPQCRWNEGGFTVRKYTCHQSEYLVCEYMF